MAYHHSPRIVTEGLSMCLDVTNPKSYSASSTIWYDIGGNRPFTASVSPGASVTPVVNIRGVNGLVANSSASWSSNIDTGSVDFAGPCTLIMWIYGLPQPNRRTLFEKAGTIYASYQQELAVTWESGSNQALSYYSKFSDYDFGASNIITDNEWNMIGIKMSTGRIVSGSRVGWRSKNGSPWVQQYTSRSSSSVVPAGEIRILTGYAGTVETGSLGMVLAYNKMLSDAEVNQIFNATRTRFGV